MTPSSMGHGGPRGLRCDEVRLELLDGWINRRSSKIRSGVNWISRWQGLRVEVRPASDCFRHEASKDLPKRDAG